MNDRMRRFLLVRKRINKLGDKAKKQYVKKCNKEFVDCISECAKNVKFEVRVLCGPKSSSVYY